MIQFTRSVTIQAPVQIVWNLHERPDVLDILTPPWQPVEVLRREGGLGPGAETEFRLYIGSLPIRWLARHTDEYEPYSQFTDIQVEGPFEQWTHRHQFTSAGDRTILTDRVVCSLPIAWLSDPLLGNMVRSQLDDLFEFRHRVTQHECEQLAHIASQRS
ncbi:MAG: SRPBCC family protein [Elainellaceae cyanobacterium]